MLNFFPTTFDRDVKVDNKLAVKNPAGGNKKKETSPAGDEPSLKTFERESQKLKREHQLSERPATIFSQPLHKPTGQEYGIPC